MSGVTKHTWGRMPDGREVSLYDLVNARGMRMQVSDYGGIITSLTAPDRDGRFANVVLGFNRLADYVADESFMGGLIGRFGNRIAGGAFTLDGVTYHLATNNAPGDIPCHLHGGVVGFHKRVWDVAAGDAAGLTLHRVSPDGEEGYPGNLDVHVAYRLTDANELHVDYTATCDAATPVNLTHHGYFNLAGPDGGSIEDHCLTIPADHVTPVNAGLIPTGALLPVAGTPFDFTTAMPVGRRINDADVQLSYGGGYDHNFVLTGWDGTLRLAATLTEPMSGRVMELLTTEPGLQFYSGNYLAGTATGQDGRAHGHRTGLCLEPQHYPDSPNQAQFPSTILRPGDVYRHTSIYRFHARQTL